MEGTNPNRTLRIFLRTRRNTTSLKEHSPELCDSNSVEMSQFGEPYSSIKNPPQECGMQKIVSTNQKTPNKERTTKKRGQ